MENFRPPSVPSTKAITCTHETNHPQFSVCEPMSCFPSTPCPSASQYYYNPAQYLAPNPGLQFQYAYNYYPYQQASQPMYPFLVQPNVVLFREHDSLDRSGQTMGALISKAARTERRMARQRSLSLSRNNASAAAAASEAYSSSLRRNAALSRDVGDQGFISSSSSGAGADLQNINKHLYTFCTPDNKKLRVLFKKELKNSDVGSLGRIVLPKREAEENLPVLYEKEGIQLVIRDFYPDQEWGFKYKYWSNNNSRMYLFENTGNFVKQNKLEVGDSVYLYEDEHKNLYISTKKVARPVQVAEPSSYTVKNNKRRTSNATNPKLNITNGTTITTSAIVNTASDNTKSNEANSSGSNSNNYNAAAADMSLLSMSPYTYVARDEEDTSSLAQLIEQLKQEPEDNTQLVPLSMDSASSSYTQHEEANNFNSHIEMSTQPSTLAGAGPSLSSSQSRAMMGMLDVDDHFEFDDYYKGLGTLPEVDWYDYCDHRFNVNMK